MGWRSGGLAIRCEHAGGPAVTSGASGRAAVGEWPWQQGHAQSRSQGAAPSSGQGVPFSWKTSAIAPRGAGGPATVDAAAWSTGPSEMSAMSVRCRVMRRLSKWYTMRSSRSGQAALPTREDRLDAPVYDTGIAPWDRRGAP